jgi:hypothetical protein
VWREFDLALFEFPCLPRRVQNRGPFLVCRIAQADGAAHPVVVLPPKAFENLQGIRPHFAWRTDYSDALKLGEAVALSILADQREMYGEEFSGFAIRRFDGTSVTA